MDSAQKRRRGRKGYIQSVTEFIDENEKHFLMTISFMQEGKINLSCYFKNIDPWLAEEIQAEAPAAIASLFAKVEDNLTKQLEKENDQNRTH
jgi:predicted RNA-binding protein with RPS1 domain